MNTHSKIFLLLLAIAIPRIVTATVSSADSTVTHYKTITISAEPDYPPYCIIDKNGNPDGFAIDLFKAAAKAVNIDVIIKIGIWSQIKQDLADGKIDALPFMGRTPEREPFFDFTLPYLSLHGAIFVKKGNSSISTLNDLKNKRVGVLLGDNAEEYARRVNLSSNIITTNTFEVAFRMLNNNEVDAVVSQRVMGLNLLKIMNLNTIAPLEFQLPDFRQDFCFAVKKGDTELLSRLNEGLSIIIANKTYDNIHLKWFGPSVKEHLSKDEVVQLVLKIFIPLIIISSLVLIILLRRMVRLKTISLKVEVEERKRAFDLLHNQQMLLEKMEKVSKVGGWDYDVATQKVTWTKGVYDIYGVQSDTFDPTSPNTNIQFFHPSDQAKITFAFQQTINIGEPYDMELRLIAQSGVRKWVRTSGQAELLNGKTVRVFGNIMDITEKILAEGKLKVAASDWQTTFDASKDAIWIMNKENEILRANKTSQNLFKNHIDGIVGKYCWDVVHGTNEPILNCPINNVKQSLSREREEIKLADRWFEIIIDPILNDQGEYNGAVHSMYDITESKLFAEALREQEEIFRHFMEHSPVYVFFKDENIRAVNLSKNYETMLGRPLNELLGKSMDELFPSDLAKKIVADDMEILNQQKTVVVDEEFSGRHYTTIKFPIVIDGKPRYLAGYTIDITERKKNEEALLELNNSLEAKVVERTSELEAQVLKLDKSQKAMLYMVEDLNSTAEDLKSERQKLEISNKELEAFSYSVSHDLRAPLRAVDGFSRMLMEDYLNVIDSEGLRLLGVIRENVQKMDKLITDLLSLSRVSRTEMTLSKIDMAAMANSMFYEVIGNNNTEKITFTIGSLPEIYADTTLMRQVWQNLIGNALKYSKPKEKQIIEIYGNSDNGKNTYCIKDNGVGFNRGYKFKIFDTFQRLHKSTEFEGTGIGLSIVHRIITRHGGQVWADSIEGESATFCFSLPVREGV